MPVSAMADTKRKEKPDPIPQPLKAGPAGSNSFFTSYPIFSIATDGQGLVITGGGGGGKAYGVINYLQAHVAIQNPTNRDLTLETIATLDTGADAAMALDFLNVQGGVWACALGFNCMLLKFNDDGLSIDPLFKWRSELGSDMHVTNFAKLAQIDNVLHLLTGGEDKIARVWRVNQEAGPGTKILNATLVKELPDHNAEVNEGDWHRSGTQFLTCGKDGTVNVWASHSQQLLATIQPRSIDKKLANENLAIRAAYFLPGNEVVVLCHHPRGPAFLMLFALANPATPLAVVTVSRTITPSMGINQARDRVVVSHAGGEKDVYALPSLRLVHRMNKHSHEMPPGKSMFVFNDLVVSASPDFSLNFYDPLARRGYGFCTWLIILLLTMLVVLLAVLLYVPAGKAVLIEHIPALKNLAKSRAEEL